MASIYSECLDSIVESGTRFVIDLERRSLRFGGKYLIKNGKFDGELGMTLSDSFESDLDGLYDRYKHSVPSSDSIYKRCYFKALREEELDDEDLFFGIPRNQARFELEFFLLSQILLGFNWEEHFGNKWFFQSETDKDLVLLKDWFIN